MLTVYLACAVVGGVILILQLILTVTGLLGEADDLDLSEGEAGHDSSMFFQVLSFRSLITAVTFFGLGGGLAQSAGLPDILTFFFATGLAVVAMVGVAWIFNLLMKLREEGNVRIEYTLGAPATVYLTIPGQRHGAGKVTVSVQNRSMEYNAVTAGDALPTGTAVKIVNVLDETTVEVACLEQAEHLLKSPEQQAPETIGNN